MAKKILYKVTAYHCPRCGSSTEPTKKYCDYCERQLLLEQYTKSRKIDIRVLIDCGNDFVNFNNIISMPAVETTPQTIDATMLEDNYAHRIVGVQSSNAFNFEMLYGNRTNELFSLIKERKQHKTRIEIQMGFSQMAFEVDSFVSGFVNKFGSNEVAKQTLSLDPVSEMKSFDSIIPNDVLDELRCPNCGAPVKSHFGACDWCGGWIGVEW